MEKALCSIDTECLAGLTGNHTEVIKVPPGVDTTDWVMAVSVHDAKRVVALYNTKFGKSGCGCLNATINVGSVSWDWECTCKACSSKQRSLSPSAYVTRLEGHIESNKNSLTVANEHVRASFRIISHIISEHRTCVDSEVEGIFAHLITFGTTFSILKLDFDVAPLVPLKQLFHRICAIHNITEHSGSCNIQNEDDESFYEHSSDEEDISDYNGEYSASESSSDTDGMDVDNE